MTVPGDIAAGRLRWASEPRLGSDLNEDRGGMTDSAVWVLDGAGTPSSVPSCCDKGATWYVEHLDAALSKALASHGDATLADAQAQAITSVQAQHAADCPDPNSGCGPSSTVAIARRCRQWLDLLAVGDSTILLDHGMHVTTLRDNRLAAIAPELRREFKNAIAVGHGYHGAEHSARHSRLVDAERQHRNREGGHWIAAYNATAAANALVARHSVGDTPSSTRRVALMTDGAPRATAILGSSRQIANSSTRCRYEDLTLYQPGTRSRSGRFVRPASSTHETQ